MRRALPLACAALILAACEEEEAPTQVGVPIGVVIDRSGNNSEPTWLDAIKLARRHVNLGLRKAGFTRLQLAVLVTDSGNEPSVALPRAQELVRAKGARALILDTSQNDIAVHRTYYDADPGNDLGVPLLCGSCTTGTMNNPAATDPDPVTQAALRNGGGWNFRCLMSTKAISQVLVRLMLEKNGGDANGDGVFKVAFYGSDEAFGRGAAKDLKAYLTALHPTPPALVEELYHPRDADVNSYPWVEDMRKLSDALSSTGATDAVPDVIAVANFAQQQAATIKAYRQSGTAVRMLHYHAMRFSSVLDSLGSLADGAEGVSHLLLEAGAEGQVFADEYLQVYGVRPVYRDSNYYDGAMALMLAAVIAAQGKDDPDAITGAGIRAAVRHTSEVGGESIGTGPDEVARAVMAISAGRPIDYQGASGPMDFDPSGNVMGRLARFRAEGGAFVDVALYDCVRDAACPLSR
ncbi:MAG: ABC transporter substrate-binding protein [Myxococcales bacterium]|nr:ABC transporter substrate-binding protein [Myxococcales bacterium]